MPCAMCCHHSQHGSRPHLNRHVLDPSARVLLLVDLYKVSPWIQSIQLIRAGRQPHGVSGTHRDLQPVRPTMPRRRKRASAAPPCESQGTSGSGHTGREVGRGTGHLTHSSVGRASAASIPSASVRTSVAGGAPAATSARPGHVPEWRRGSITVASPPASANVPPGTGSGRDTVPGARASTQARTATPDDRVAAFRLSWLLLDVVSDALRRVFRHCWNESHGTRHGRWVDSAFNGSCFLSGERNGSRLLPKQTRCAIQVLGLVKGTRR